VRPVFAKVVKKVAGVVPALPIDAVESNFVGGVPLMDVNV
jgi:hypothetical protein